MKWECEACGDLHPSSWVVCPTTGRPPRRDEASGGQATPPPCEPEPAARALERWVAWYFAPASFGALAPHVGGLVRAAFHAGWSAREGQHEGDDDGLNIKVRTAGPNADARALALARGALRAVRGE